VPVKISQSRTKRSYYRQ